MDFAGKIFCESIAVEKASATTKTIFLHQLKVVDGRQHFLERKKVRKNLLSSLRTQKCSRKFA